MAAGINQNGVSASTGPPTNVTVVIKEEETGECKKDVWAMVTREARAVSVWALAAPLARLLFDPSSIVYALTGCLLSVLPQAVAKNLAPGFVFASAWLLFAIRDSFGVVPNVPLRICETVMGRLSFRDLCIVLPIHFLCALSTFMILKLFLPSSMESVALAPIAYSDNNAWFTDFIREVAVNCAFTVTFLVMPELFALNKIPRFLTTVIMYPLYSFSVDSNGMASTFGPNVLYALTAVAERSEGGLGQSRSRFVGVIIGGFVGGNVMRRYFPDDVKR